MSKFVATIALLALQFFVSYWVMTTAWGLTIQSWGAFIGGFVLTIFLTVCQVAVSADKS